MGFYARTIFPWLCDLALDRPQVAEQRRELLSQAEGDVLEIGIGTGLNLAHYPAEARRIAAVAQAKRDRDGRIGRGEFGLVGTAKAAPSAGNHRSPWRPRPANPKNPHS